jgi:hypothetical protein
LNSVNLVRVVVRANGPTGVSPGAAGTVDLRVRGGALVLALALFAGAFAALVLLARLVDAFAMCRYLVGDSRTNCLNRLQQLWQQIRSGEKEKIGKF